MAEEVDQDWLRLDNAAKIYPASHTEESPAMFRISITLRRAINYERLGKALERMIRRCPYFQVHLRRGFFWYYLQRHGAIPPLRPLPSSPVSPMEIRRRGAHLLNVLVRGRTLAVDFSHILTDGHGGARFTASLAAEYLRLGGFPVPQHESLLNPDDEPGGEEFQDAYRANYRKGVPKPEPMRPAYHIPGLPLSRLRRTITASIPLDEALSLVKSRGVRLTEYLTAVCIDALRTLREQHRRDVIKPTRSIIRVEVPVDMRRHYPSRTMRNFSLFISPELDLRIGEYDFVSTLKTVHHSMNVQLDRNQLDRQIARNVWGETNALVRSVPLALKDLYLGYLHHKLGDSLYSGVISNLGPFTIPDEMANEVSDVRFMLAPNPVMKTVCSVVSYAGRLLISFVSVIESRELERLFLAHLVRAGLHVVVSESVP